MNVDKAFFLPLLNGAKHFIVPLYQRPYSWTLEECKQLWDDITNYTSNKPYFIGSIVYVQKGTTPVGGSIQKLYLIDGQQRITTISLMLLALTREMKRRGHKIIIKDQDTEEVIAPEKLVRLYLINDMEDAPLKYKINLTEYDRETFTSLIEETELQENYSRNIKNNYDYFEGLIKNADLNNVYSAIAKLMIIDVALDENDNPQMIFESLNSTGKDLTQTDLIRNYILMGIDTTKQGELYTKYWYPTESVFIYGNEGNLFDRFMRDYLTIKMDGKIPNMGAVYNTFKQYSRTNYSENIFELVQDVYKYSKYFAKLALLKEEEDKELYKIFHDIENIKVDVSYPLLLKVYDDFSNGLIGRQDFIEILKLVESYVFRRAICGIPTNSLNKTFATIYKEIDTSNYLESFKASLLLKDSYRRFPNDEEFMKELFIKDVYNIRNRNYLLAKLENYNNKEIVDISACTIEHIMPQNEKLSLKWRKELGENWKEVQQAYLHTIGNLTLTLYNSELSDRSFIEKRDMKGGFRDSKLSLNKDLSNIENWNENTIQKRANKLIKIASEIWEFPQLDDETLEKYKAEQKKEKEDEQYNLEDYTFLKGDRLILFEELNKRVLNIDSSVKREIKKYYIAYKSITNFLDIVPQIDCLNMTLNMPFEAINDPKKMGINVTDIGHWGNGDVRIKLQSLDQIEYVMFLVKQSFDYQKENGD